MHPLSNMSNYLIKLSIIVLLAASNIVAPQDTFARKKENKYEKKQVTLTDTTIVAPTEKEVAVVDAPRQLYGEWTLMTMRKKEVSTTQRPYIYLDFANHKVYGCNGCNDLNGKFSQSGTNISFSEMITTENECHQTTSERSIMKTLGEVQRFKITSLFNIEYLHLMNNKGNVLMVLKRQNLDALNGAWKVKELDGEHISDSDMRFVIDIDMRAIHGNSGMNIINGIITIDPNKDFAIQFEDFHTGGNIADGIGMETNVLLAFEQAESCKRINDNEMALLDKQGKIVLVLSRIEIER